MQKCFVGVFGILLIGALFFASGAAPPLPAASSSELENQEKAQEDFKIKVDVSLVTTDVTVIGQASQNLTAEDFAVFEDGVAQPVSYFSLDQIPLAVGLLIDASESIRPYLPVLQVAGISALRRLRPEDQVVLYSFSLNPKRLTDLTADRVEIAEAISKIEVKYGTAIYDTIVDASNYLSKHAPNYRRALILISDNYRWEGRHNANRALYELLESASTLINVKTQSIMPYDATWATSDGEILNMVNESGGEVFRVNAPGSLRNALESAILNLRKQYTLGFNPSNPGKTGTFHKLNIKLADEKRCPGCRLRSRSGYYAGVSAPAAPIRASKPPTRTPEQTDELLIQRSIFSAGTVDTEFNDIPFTVQMTQQTGSAEEPQLKIDLQIPFSRIGTKIEGNKRFCRVRIVVFYSNQKGKILGNDSKIIEGNLSDATWVQTMVRGIQYSTTIPIKAEKQLVKVVVYDEGSDRVGTQTIRLPQ